MANFTQGDFNTGIERQITIIDMDTGLPIDLGGELISFESHPNVEKIKVKPISSTYNRFKRSYDGWSGKMVIARVNGNADALQSAQEQKYHNRLGQKYFEIYEETVNTDDGTVDNFSYVGCCIDMTTAGDWKKDSSVEITLDFDAQDRR